MKKKSLPSFLVLTLIATMSFASLFLIHTITDPVIKNRENETLLTLLDLSTFGSLTINDIETTDGNLKTSGVVRLQVIKDGTTTVGVVYDIETTGYNAGVHFRIGIRNSVFQHTIVISHSETPAYGGILLNNLPTLLKQLSITDAGVITATLVGASTGVTLTRLGILNAVLAAASDYQQRGGQ
jgi:Na+-translocating ferredoxin:NAD+ oxidoreductase RnfG subunit